MSKTTELEECINQYQTKLEKLYKVDLEKKKKKLQQINFKTEEGINTKNSETHITDDVIH